MFIGVPCCDISSPDGASQGCWPFINEAYQSENLIHTSLLQRWIPTRKKIQCRLGGGSKYFLFSSLFGEDSHFDKYFSDGLVQPPTSHLFVGPCNYNRCWHLWCLSIESMPSRLLFFWPRCILVLLPVRKLDRYLSEDWIKYCVVVWETHFLLERERERWSGGEGWLSGEVSEVS